MDKRGVDVNSFKIISKNGKRKVIIENTSTGIDKRKEAVEFILRNK